MSNIKKLSSIALFSTVLGGTALTVQVNAEDNKTSSSKVDESATKETTKEVDAKDLVTEKTEDNSKNTTNGVATKKVEDGVIPFDNVTTVEKDGWLYMVSGDDVDGTIESQGAMARSNASALTITNTSASNKYFGATTVLKGSQMAYWGTASAESMWLNNGVEVMQMADSQSSPSVGSGIYGSIAGTGTNPKIVFCVELGVSISQGGGFNESALSHADRIRLELIAYYGWANRTKSVTNYNHTQNMIWEFLNGNGYGVVAPQLGDKLTHMSSRSGSIWDNYDQFKKEVNASIDKYMAGTKPDKGGSPSSPVKIKDGETVTITDTNGLLAFDGVTKSNATIGNGESDLVDVVDLKDGKLTLKSKSSNAKATGKGVYVNAVPNDKTGTTMVYKKASQQTTAWFNVNDPQTMRVYVETEVDKEKKGSLEITKTGETATKVIKEVDEKTGLEVSKVGYEQKGLAGVTYKVTYPNGKTTTVKTGSDGKATLTNLDAGTYKYQEVGAPNGYVIDPTVREVKVESIKYREFPSENNNKESPKVSKVTQSNDLQPVELDVLKEVESMDSWGTDGIKTSNVPLEGIVFGLYNTEDIKVGDETIAKDTLMGIAETDAEGIAKMKEKYPESNFYIKELKTTDNHQLINGKLAEFDLTRKGNVADRTLYLYSNGLSETKGGNNAEGEELVPFNNKLKLGKFRLVKEVEVRDSQDASDFKSHYETGKIAKGTEFELTLDKAKDGVTTEIKDAEGEGDTSVETEDSTGKQDTKDSSTESTKPSASVDDIIDNTNKATGNKATLVVGDSGELLVKGLPEGEYTLKETKSPTKQHKVTTDEYKIEVTSEGSKITLDGKEVGTKEDVEVIPKTLEDFIKEATDDLLAELNKVDEDGDETEKTEDVAKSTTKTTDSSTKGDETSDKDKKEGDVITEKDLTEEQLEQIKEIAQQSYDKYIEENGENPTGTEEYDTVTIKNDLKVGEFDFSKKDLTGEKELKGAEVHIKGKDTDFSFVTGDKPTRIKLEDGTYTFTETTAPTGYIRTSEVGTFTIKDGEITKCILRNRPQALPKTGNELEKSASIIALVGAIGIFGITLSSGKGTSMFNRKKKG